MDLKDTLPAGFDSWVYCVDEGTVVGQDDQGNDMIVTENAVVNLGNLWFVTESLFNTIKAKTAKRLS